MCNLHISLKFFIYQILTFKIFLLIFWNKKTYKTSFKISITCYWFNKKFDKLKSFYSFFYSQNTGNIFNNN